MSWWRELCIFSGFCSIWLFPVSGLAQRPMGIDVSHWQGTALDWPAIKNSGISFAWAKATEGTGYTDNTFVLNASNGKNAGVYMGAYHYAHPELNTAGSEATHFWAVAGAYITGDGLSMMPMIDIEGSAFSGNVGASTLSAWINQWCAAVSNNAFAAGLIIKPMVYVSACNAGHLDTSVRPTTHPWIANYNGNNPQTSNPWTVCGGNAVWGPGVWEVWQYSSTTSVPNHSGNVDGDVFNGTLADLVATLVIGGGSPLITQQPAGLTLPPGASAVFSITAAGSTPLSYQWRRNAADIDGATASTYTRANVQNVDCGSYSVVVSNLLGSATSSDAVLIVMAPPAITSQPQDQVVISGLPASIDLSVVGAPPVTYQWRFNNDPIAGATSAPLVLAAAQSSDYGPYSVEVSNPYGSVTSSNAMLAVIALASWGDNSWGQGQSMVPTLTNVLAVAAGAWHSLALRSDGSVLAWGNNFAGQCNVPSDLSGALAIGAGFYHSLAVTAAGKVVAWGDNGSGQSAVPANLSEVISVAAGAWHSLALRRDGTVAAWGDNSLGQADVPAGLSNVVMIAAGGNHSLALRADGTLVAWGENTGVEGNFVGQSLVPWGVAPVMAIGAGEYHTLAVRADGTVVAWGEDSEGQCDVPPGLTNVVAVAGGGAHSLALLQSGSVVGWGANWNGQCALPPLGNALGLSAGENHSVAMVAGALPAPRLLSPSRKGNTFSLLVQSLFRNNYALEFKNSPSTTNWTALSTNAGNGTLKVLSDAGAAGPHRIYRVRRW